MSTAGREPRTVPYPSASVHVPFLLAAIIGLLFGLTYYPDDRLLTLVTCLSTAFLLSIYVVISTPSIRGNAPARSLHVAIVFFIVVLACCTLASIIAFVLGGLIDTGDSVVQIGPILGGATCGVVLSFFITFFIGRHVKSTTP